MTFTFQQLSKPLTLSVAELGFVTPTDIQAQTIPILLGDDTDFVGQAQTGTGKTAAFCLPLLEKLDTSKPGIQALIIGPTRELVNQINQDLIKFAKHLPVKTATVYGGVGYKDQISNLKTAHIVIATPGRAIDLLNSGKLHLQSSKFLIIDEADEMLKMGFIDDVETLMSSVSKQAQTWMFSATMPKPIVQLMEQKLKSPKILKETRKAIQNENISQSFCYLQKKDFTKALKTILLTEEDFFGIVFCETREETKNLSDKLSNTVANKRIISLHGDLNQKQRDDAIDKFKTKKADILVCTDVAARGLDISLVTHVINMGLPRKLDSYVHRIGRTGRAGKSGKAISFVSPSDYRNLKFIEKMSNAKLEQFKIPCPIKSKQNKIGIELEKMQGIKKALIERGKNFSVDESFEIFNSYFTDMSKQDIVKLLFAYHFSNDLKAIDDSIETLKNSVLKPSFSDRESSGGDQKRRRSSGGGRGRDSSRSSGGRSSSPRRDYRR